MTIRKKQSKWVRFSNKALSGLLFLLGFGPSLEEQEMGEITPMYGMPASNFASKKKVSQEKHKKIKSLPEDSFHLSVLKQGENVY